VRRHAADQGAELQRVRLPVCRADAPTRIPEATAGDLEQIDDRNLLDAEQLRRMPYRRLLDWCGTDDIRLELARRARGYRKGWKFHAKQARLAALASGQ
jgi:hypothetical protein